MQNKKIKKPFKPKSGRKPKSRPTRDNATRDDNIPDINNDIKLKANDPDWYMHNPVLADSAGAIPFSYQLGTYLNVYQDKQYVIPGLCNIVLIPAFGPAMSMTDPINIAAVKIYSYVRHQNSGHSNYDHPDLMMYLLAMGQAYSAHEWMKRIYGYLNTYSVMNKYIPRAYAKADNIDFDDFIKNLADFRYYINEVAVKLSAFAVPQSFDLFKRHRYIYSNIHMDEESSRASLYMFTPGGFYQFDNTTSETGTSLQWQEWAHTGTPKKFTEMVSYIDNLLSTVFGDEDAGIMSGDILKAYGADSIYVPSSIDYDYSVLPIYDATILSQIHNAKFYGSAVARPVSQTGNGVIINQQLVNVTANYPREGSLRTVLSTPIDNPTPADIFEMTRLSSKKVTLSGESDVCAIMGGSEIVANIILYVYTAANDDFNVLSLSGDGYRITDATTSNRVINMANYLTKFRYHPILQYINTLDNDRLVMLGDVDNVTTVGGRELENLHMTALLSLLGV